MRKAPVKRNGARRIFSCCPISSPNPNHNPGPDPRFDGSYPTEQITVNALLDSLQQTPAPYYAARVLLSRLLVPGLTAACSGSRCC